MPPHAPSPQRAEQRKRRPRLATFRPVSVPGTSVLKASMCPAAQGRWMALSPSCLLSPSPKSGSLSPSPLHSQQQVTSEGQAQAQTSFPESNAPHFPSRCWERGIHHCLPGSLWPLKLLLSGSQSTLPIHPNPFSILLQQPPQSAEGPPQPSGVPGILFWLQHCISENPFPFSSLSLW